VVVSADDAATTAALRARMALTYAMVSDPELEVARRYGVRQAGMFVVDANGIVRFVHVASNPVDRLPTAELLTALEVARRGPRPDRPR
jgi:alkyl hydroperoxide reductase subunit AhpC